MRIFHHESVKAALRSGDGSPQVEVVTASGAALLALPESLGGLSVPGSTNPEQLFGSAYAGCMVFAVEHALRRARRDPGELAGLGATAEVRIGRAADRTNRLEVDLVVELPAIEQAEAEALCEEATRFCPFHQAIKGNVDATMTVVGRPGAVTTVPG